MVLSAAEVSSVENGKRLELPLVVQPSRLLVQHSQ